MKMFFFIIPLSLFFLANAYAQNSDWKNFAIENKIPLDQIHPSHLPSDINKQKQNFKKLFEALNKLPDEKLKEFLDLDFIPFGGGNIPLKLGFKDAKEVFKLIETEGYETKVNINIKAKDPKGVVHEASQDLSIRSISIYLEKYSKNLAVAGNIADLNPDPSQTTKKEDNVTIPEEVKKVPVITEKSKFDCQAELNKSLDDFFKENREEFIKAQFRITSLKLAQKTKGNNKITLEEMVKTEKSQIDNIKDSQGSATKLKEMYRTYGIEDDTKVIESLEKLSSRTTNLNYYKGSQRLLNEDLSAYILANVADSKNTLFDESDAATAWLFDEMQKKYLAMGNEKFGSQFNLMNLSSASFLITQGKDNSETQISQRLADSEKTMTDSYQDFLTKFKSEKKECFEKGEQFDNACDEDLLGLIEKGFADDLKNLIKEMRSDSIKPEFDINHFKLADTQISFDDLIASDISNLKNDKTSSTSKTTAKEKDKKTKKVVISASRFSSEIYNKITTPPPFLSDKKMKNNYSSSTDYSTVIGDCKVNVFRMNNGKTRVEMLSPENHVSYNLTISTNVFSTSATDYAVARALDSNFNKPHIRNSCLAN